MCNYSKRMAFKPSLALFLFVMRKIFLIILWLLLQMPLCMQAQEPQRFFERHYIDDLIFMNENDLLVLGADEAADVALYKVDENGELINMVVLPSIQDNNSLRHLARFGDGSVGLISIGLLLVVSNGLRTLWAIIITLIMLIPCGQAAIMD